MIKFLLYLSTLASLLITPSIASAASCQVGATFCNVSEGILYKAVNAECLYTPVSKGCTSQPTLAPQPTATPTSTPVTSITGSCQVNYSLSNSNPAPNSDLTVTISTIKNDSPGCVVFTQDNQIQNCGISGNNIVCTVNSGSAGSSHTLQFKSGQSQAYPAGTNCGSGPIICNSTSYTTAQASPTASLQPTATNQGPTFIGYIFSEDITIRDNASAANSHPSTLPSFLYAFRDQTPGVKTLFVRFFYSDGTHIDSQKSIFYRPATVDTTKPNLLNTDIQSNSINLPNILSSGTLGDMRNASVPANSQNVQWFGDTTNPAPGGQYTLTGTTSNYSSLRTDIYVPQSGPNPNKFDSSSPGESRFHIGGKQYFAVIERAGAIPATFENIALYHSDQKVQWFGSATSGAPGNYTISGDVTGDGAILIDVYKNNSYVQEYTSPSTFTITADEYFAAIDRAYSGNVEFNNVRLTKE